MRVVLADTDEVFLEIVQSFLWDRGYDAEIATSGLECVSILREFGPDALVIDRDLLWGGTDAVLELMAESEHLNRVTIILTADGSLDDELLVNSSLPGAYLAKPYRLSELLAQLNEVKRSKASLHSSVEWT